MDEKRTHFRKSVQVEAWIVDVSGNTWSSVNLLDISCGGAAFVTKQELAPGSTHMFRFCLPGNPMRISVIVKIIYSTTHPYLDGYRVGVEFARVLAEDLVLIQRFVEESSSDQA